MKNFRTLLGQTPGGSSHGGPNGQRGSRPHGTHGASISMSISRDSEVQCSTLGSGHQTPASRLVSPLMPARLIGMSQVTVVFATTVLPANIFFVRSGMRMDPTPRSASKGRLEPGPDPGQGCLPPTISPAYTFPGSRAGGLSLANSR